MKKLSSLLRAATALSAGLVRESSEVVLPPPFRRTRVYQSIVEQTLRFLIENVGQVEGAYPRDEALPEDFLVQRTAGNGIEWVSLAVFHASPVWVLAAMADVSGAGNKVLSEIAATLEQEGYLTGASSVRTITDLLDALERGSGHLAETFNTPPLNREALLKDWERLKQVVTDRKQVEADWALLKQTASQQSKPLMEVSTAVALNTLRSVTGPVLDHYGNTLKDLNEIGFTEYASREMAPYWKAVVTNLKK